MQNEEIHLKVNAIHRLKTVILSIGQEKSLNELIPYLKELARTEDDEVLYAIAEEIGNVFTYLVDKTSFLQLLEALAGSSETVVREQAAKSLNLISKSLTDAEIQNVYAPLVIKLAQGEWFPPRQTSCHLFTECYTRAGSQKDKLRKKFIELCNEDQPMIRRTCARILG
jgi:serine/threonine-protein phosphatase 2A regulatory subunit A